MRVSGTVVAVLAVVLAGCASESGRGLTPGVSTEAQVEALMGPSADRRQAAGGEVVRYYPRLPHGRETFAARFREGKLVALEQRLTEANVARLKADVSKAEDVRDLLGPPYRTTRYALSGRTVWVYPMSGLFYPRLLHVEFTPDEVVREVRFFDDTDRDVM